MMFRKSMVWAPWITGGIVLAAAVGFPAAQAQNKGARKKVTPPQKTLTGEQVFKAQCASCHGARGEGGPGYSRPLEGNQSPQQLATFISKQMPPGPKKCAAPDAQKVAAYMYDAFYSPIAQERNRPARVALSRLTVRQIRNSVSDLVGSFRAERPEGEATGLHAEYFKAKRFNKEDRVVERVDPQVQFNFGEIGPSGGEFQPHQFSIRWDGSVSAPDTGEYQIIVRTEHAARLWLNDQQKPLIDAWVKSGNDNEYKATIFLVGGRTYPIRLEFTKSTQGVDDTKKKEGTPPAKASIALSWKCPKLAEEPIPTRCLYPTKVAPEFVLTTAFPPDDRSMGYERGNSISKEWDEATTEAALETADYILSNLKELAGAEEDGPQLRTFCRKFVERAQRKPLDKATEDLYIDRQFETAPNTETAIKRVVLRTLTSPRFLYREAGAENTDQYAIASRLSFALWDSLPDKALLQAAAQGKLATREQVQAQAERMVVDPRAWYKQREFFLQWLKMDQYPDLVRDPKKYPGFSETVATDLRTSMDLTLENVVRSERSDFRELMLTNKYYMNGRLASMYGVKMPANAPFQPVVMDPKDRAGVLTHPYMLASQAYFSTSSPIHRGVLLARNIMGRTLSPPPAAFAPLAASLHPKLTTRERVTLQTKPATCMGCHGMINPLGFTMEKFDAIGRLRTQENGQPVNSNGSYAARSGKIVKFTGAPDLAKFIATSDEAQSAFVQRFFQYMVKQPIRAYGAQALPELQKDFKTQEYSIRQLVVDIATTSALPHKG